MHEPVRDILNSNGNKLQKSKWRTGDGSVAQVPVSQPDNPVQCPEPIRWKESDKFSSDLYMTLPPTLEKYIKIEENHYRMALGNGLKFCSLLWWQCPSFVLLMSSTCPQASPNSPSSSSALWTLGVPWGSILMTHSWHLQSYRSLPSCGKDKELDAESICRRRYSECQSKQTQWKTTFHFAKVNLFDDKKDNPVPRVKKKLESIASCCRSSSSSVRPRFLHCPLVSHQPRPWSDHSHRALLYWWLFCSFKFHSVTPPVSTVPYWLTYVFLGKRNLKPSLPPALTHGPSWTPSLLWAP